MRFRLLALPFLAGALFSCNLAHAAKWDRSTDYYWNVGNGNITTFPQQGSGNMWSTGTKTPTATGPQFKSAAKALPFNPSPYANFNAKFTPGNMAKALFSPAAAIPLLAGGILSELFNQACVRIAGGTMQLADGAAWEECKMVQGTGYEYRMANPVNQYHNNVWLSNKASTCQGVRNAIATQNPNGSYGYQVRENNPVTPTTGSCRVYNSLSPAGCAPDSCFQVYLEGFQNRTVTTTTQEGWQPLAEAAAETKVKDKLDAWTQADFLYGYSSTNGKPAGGTGAVLDAIMNSGTGVEVDPGQVSVTGPASQAGQPVVKEVVDPATGNKTITTTTTTNNYTYGPATTDNRVTITNNQTTTTITQNYNASTGQTTTTSTETTTETKEPDEEKTTPVVGDAELPEQPELYEPKYPNGPAGVWSAFKMRVSATPLFQLPSQLAPNLGDSGGCPAWSVPLNVGIASFGVQDATVPCFVWTFMRVCIIIGALFLARRLIFGG